MHQIYLTSLHEVTVPEKLKIEIDLNDFVEEEGVAGGRGIFAYGLKMSFFNFYEKWAHGIFAATQSLNIGANHYFRQNLVLSFSIKRGQDRPKRRFCKYY